MQEVKRAGVPRSSGYRYITDPASMGQWKSQKMIKKLQEPDYQETFYKSSLPQKGCMNKIGIMIHNDYADIEGGEFHRDPSLCEELQETQDFWEKEN